MKILIVTTDAEAVGPLERLCAGHDVSAAVVGVEIPLARGDEPEYAVDGTLSLALTEKPDLVLGSRSPADRALLGALAGRMRVTMLPRLVRLGRGRTVVHTDWAGLTECDAEIVTTTVACADIGAARRVVGVGRGVETPDDLALVKRLADALGAELVCTRPIAEVEGWLPRSAYVGVSGRRIAPDLYVAVGISGQLQHTLGVRGAKVIVAINTDPSAPIMAEADYAIVGDLRTIVPELIEALPR